MDTYRHSCPFCGQHIEYTAGYCGSQMACPTCGKTVTFPAVPPGGKRAPLRLKREETHTRRRWSFSIPVIIAAMREFEHWNIVWAGVIPFLVLSGLLVGATVIRKKVGEGPVMPAVEKAHADTTWQQATSLAKADEDVQEKVAVVNQAKAALAYARAQRKAVVTRYQNVRMDSYVERQMTSELNAADQAISQGEARVNQARQTFECSFANYQKLGGKVDYRRQTAD